MPSPGPSSDITVPDVVAVNEMIGELFAGSNNSCVELSRTVAVARREISEAERRPTQRRGNSTGVVRRSRGSSDGHRTGHLRPAALR
mgnify:CR=1 FL=1